jgi:tetratricopeptide (TPR) repeat protein
MRFQSHAAAVAMAVLASAVPARADRVDDVAAARDHFAKGKRLYDVGRFAEAASEYEAAYQAKDDPALLFNLGQAYRLAGQPGKALLAYKAYLRNVPDAENRADVESRLADLQATIDRPRHPIATPSSTPVLVASPPSQRPSVARRPWFWATLAGTVVVAGCIAVGIVYGAHDPSPTAGRVIGP